MTKVIAIANQKGGVGKTSTTVNLGAGLVRQGYAVLAIDFDPQANLTMALGFKSPDDMEYTVSNVLAKAMDEEPIDPSEGIFTTAEGVDLMPSSIQLSRYELSLVNEMNRESMLRQFVDAAKPNYDYILIDCAPSLNVLALNALTAADSVLIPTQPEFFSNAGLQMLLSTVSKVRKKINPSLNIEGVLVTMMDKRPNFTRELVSQLREAYGGTIKVFNTEIPNEFTIKKTDVVSGRPVEGATFEIYSADGTLFATVTTDRNGEFNLTAIPAGHYTMIETVAPAGYALSNQTYSFDIDENGNITGDINITDEPTALIIDKINAFTGEPFAGIEFTLMNANGEIVKTVMTENGWRVPSDRGEESFVTDKNGHVEFRYLPVGEYTLLENTPEGYIAVGTVTVTIGSNNGISNPATRSICSQDHTLKTMRPSETRWAQI